MCGVFVCGNEKRGVCNGYCLTYDGKQIDFFQRLIQRNEWVWDNYLVELRAIRGLVLDPGDTPMT